jgi:hypothetical protein
MEYGAVAVPQDIDQGKLAEVCVTEELEKVVVIAIYYT